MTTFQEQGKRLLKQVTIERAKKNLTTSRRALSPIFATLIILAVVTILFVPVFIWATGTSSRSQDSWQLSGTITAERIIIEEVNLKYTQTNLCSIYLRNIGKTAVSINDVLITAPNGTVFVYQKNEFSTKNPVTGNNQTTIVQGDMLEIRIINLKNLPVNLPANKDKLFTVKVFTTRGVGAEFQIVLEF